MSCVHALRDQPYDTEPLTRILCKMNSVSPVLPMTRTLLALNFFIITIQGDAVYPALMVDCGFHIVLSPSTPLDTEGRQTPSFFTIERDDHVCYACPPTNEYEHRVSNLFEPLRILFIRDSGVTLLHLDQPMPKCESRVRPSIRVKTGKETVGRVYQVGFQALRPKTRRDVEIEHLKETIDLRFREFLRICFDLVVRQTISATNSIEMANFMPTASNSKTDLQYEKNEDLLGTDLDHLYLRFRTEILPRMKTESVKNPFAHELGIEKIQLAPKDDYILDTWKVVSYLDINTTPVWTILIFKWNAVEIFVREIGKMVTIIKVETGITGTSDLAEKYYNDYDRSTKSESRLRLPKYMWKIVTVRFHDSHTLKMAAILIIMHNDPFTEDQTPLCKDICASNGWFVSNNDYRTGLIYCCEVTKEITSQLNSNQQQAYKILNLAQFGYYKIDKLSDFLSRAQKEVYDW